MSITTTPNMGLTIPGTGTEPGPNWANEVNGDLSIIDQHNHTLGQGVQITPSGMNINSDLSFQSNNATNLNSARFVSLSAPLAGASPNLGCLYVSGNELYYNDESGNQVKITSTGSVNAGAGSITGLPSGTASATFSAGTFTWQSATNTPAAMNCGPVSIGQATANAKTVTLNSVNGLANNYQLYMPTIPAAASALALDTSGNIAAITSSSNIGSTSANAIANARTRATGSTVAAGGVAISSSCGFFSTGNSSWTDVTNLSVTITTTGRPVMVMLQPDGLSIASLGTIQQTTNQINVQSNFQILNGSTSIFGCQTNAGNSNAAGKYQVFAPPFLGGLDISVNGVAGTYTYKVQAETAALGGTALAEVSNCVLVAYEI